jgi:dehydrodolichyl diphosphate syntase complex subunit NUS1
MSVIATTCLVLIHVVYAIYNAAYALLARHVHYPRLLTETRRRIPNHLGLLLTSDAGANEEDVRYVYERAVRDAMRWCRIVGISRLSAYDPQGSSLPLTNERIARLI